MHTTLNLQEIFNLLDRNGRGSVETGKIGDLLRYAGLNPTEKTCSHIIGKHMPYIALTDNILCREAE